MAGQPDRDDGDARHVCPFAVFWRRGRILVWRREEDGMKEV